ncbi:hypothetical protein M947_11640 [Sulfurimonas hongkongensis]|uniref:Uncharacterized protein n=1 Tax=Sulfurimonas hongkongensis TaxID=1172190 RepID=T0KLN4_9BACT|nr:hypothetical protein [Sulfurimonas hongkongensis]EQB34283.1 hypothetical protein M947_11640 [Sulfurimonas hongkongensis]
MSIKEAKLIVNEYDLSTDESSFEIVLEALEKFGSARAVLLEGLKPQYKYLKKISKLLAMLDEKPQSDVEAQKISSLMYEIYTTVSNDSKSTGEDIRELMAAINVRKTFNPSDKELWVMNYLGGREFILNITYQEPNALERKIKEAINKYDNLADTPRQETIQNKSINDLAIQRY